MQFHTILASFAVLASASFVAAAPSPIPAPAPGLADVLPGMRMPLPLRLAANSPSARQPKGHADPYALPWVIADRW